MKRVWIAPLTAASILVFTAGISAAQAPNQPHTEHPSNTTKQNSDSGTRPENMGTSGWTGGRQDADSRSDTTGAGPSAAENNAPRNINDDSEYATGQDLKGAPAKFPATQTPE